MAKFSKDELAELADRIVVTETKVVVFPELYPYNGKRVRAIASVVLNNALHLNGICVLSEKDGLALDYPKVADRNDASAVKYIVVPSDPVVGKRIESAVLSELAKYGIGK